MSRREAPTAPRSAPEGGPGTSPGAAREAEHDLEALTKVRWLQAGTDVEVHSLWIFERYYSHVRGYFLRRGFRREEAEELAQDTFFQLFREIRSFRGESRFKSWLFAIAANIRRNERRRRGQEMRNAPEVDLDVPAGGAIPPLEIPAEQRSPERIAYDRERRKRLSRAIADLPTQQRHCLVLRLERGLKYREIAAVLKISLDTVKAHLFQAKQRLKDLLGEDLGEWRDE